MIDKSAPAAHQETGGILLTRGEVAKVMDALESDSSIDDRRAAFEMIQEKYERPAHQERTEPTKKEKTNEAPAEE